MEIEDSRYAELVAAEQKAKTLEPRVADLEEKAGKVDGLQTQVDKLEIDKKAAEDARDEEKSKRETLEETARAGTLAADRKGKLGTAFLEKLPDSIKTRLDEQAKTLSDEDWTSRLEELSELTGVKSDAKKDGGSGDDPAPTDDELAAAGTVTNPGGGNSHATAEAKRRSIVAGVLS